MSGTADEKGSLQDGSEKRNAETPELEEGFRKVVDRIRRDLIDDPPSSGQDEENLPVLGDFAILRQIGSGGMARVYEAEQISLRRRVALKILPSHLRFSDDAVKKFKREAEAGGRQNHPGIVAIHAVGEHEGVHFIAQELVVDGRTLADRLEDLRGNDEIPSGKLRDAARLIAEVADALQHAHDAGVIHRDVKPSNILLTVDGRPKVTDFGLAKVVDALALSRTGDFTGTPYYMSPEQAMSRRIRITHSTDIFSLGVTFYEYLTLERPFEGKTSHDVLKKIVFHEPRDPRKLNSRVPRDLAVICLKAMEKKPEDRYPDMAALAADLRRYLTGEVIMARPAGLVVKLLKRVKRNPVVSAAAVVTALAVIVLLTLVPRVIVQKEREVARKEKQARVAVEKKEREIARKEREKRIAVEREAENSRAILDFLKEMLASPTPVASGREVKVKDILAEASQEIDQAFPDKPEIELQLRITIAFTYYACKEYPQAEKQFEKALDLCVRLRGEEHKETIYVMTQLASAWSCMGKFTKAEELVRRAMETGIRAHGEECSHTATAMARLGKVLTNLARFDESEALYRRALDIQRRVIGDGHYLTLGTMHDLGELLWLQARFDEAETVYREALDVSHRVHGADAIETVNAGCDLARVLMDRGRLDESERYLKEAVAYYRERYKEDTFLTLDIRTGLARIEGLRGNYPEAEKICREVLDVVYKNHGEESHQTLSPMNILGTALLNQGKFKEGEAMMRKTIELRSRLFGDTSTSGAEAINTLACLLKSQRRFDEAVPLFRRALDINKTLLGTEHPQTLLCMNNLGTTLASLDDFPAAAQLLKEAFETAGNSLPPQHWTIVVFQANYGRCLFKLGRYDEAEPLLEESCSRMVATLGPHHNRTRAVVQYMIDLYKALDKPEKVKDYQDLLGLPTQPDP